MPLSGFSGHFGALVVSKKVSLIRERLFGIRARVFGVRERLFGALRFADQLCKSQRYGAGGRYIIRCTQLQHRTCKTSRGDFVTHSLCAHGFSTKRARLAVGTSLRSWFQKKCLLPGGILIFLPKKVAAKWWDFYFFFQKKWLLPAGIFIFFSSDFET